MTTGSGIARAGALKLAITTAVGAILGALAGTAILLAGAIGAVVAILLGVVAWRVIRGGRATAGSFAVGVAGSIAAWLLPIVVRMPSCSQGGGSQGECYATGTDVVAYAAAGVALFGLALAAYRLVRH